MSDAVSTTMNRRTFLGAAGAAALSMASPARGAAATTRANNRIVIAGIGVGGQGGGLVNGILDRAESHNLAVGAVCDVYTKRRDHWAARANCPGYIDYRRILERKDIDAVTIGTPDHWHARMSIEAMEAGKDVYCEKPMTLTWQEAKEVAAAARRTGRVYQCGAQSASGGQFHTARRLIREGVIGKVIWSQAGYCRNDPRGDWNWPIDPAANPGNIDWDLWLGPAPKRPWSPERFFRFRKFWDYSGGLATDLLYHALAHMQAALGFEFPVEVAALGGNYIHAEREVPDTFHVLLKYPSNHTVFLVSTQENHDTPPDAIRGQLGTLTFENGITVYPQVSGEERWTHGPLATGKAIKQGEKVTHIRFAVDPGWDHMDNWLECLRTRQLCTLHADAAYKVMVGIHLSVLSYREGRVIHFDPVKEEVVG